MALEEVGMSEKGKKKKRKKGKKRLNAFKGFATSVERLIGRENWAFIYGGPFFSKWRAPQI